MANKMKVYYILFLLVTLSFSLTVTSQDYSIVESDSSIKILNADSDTLDYTVLPTNTYYTYLLIDSLNHRKAVVKDYGDTIVWFEDIVLSPESRWKRDYDAFIVKKENRFGVFSPSINKLLIPVVLDSVFYDLTKGVETNLLFLFRDNKYSFVDAGVFYIYEDDSPFFENVFSLDRLIFTDSLLLKYNPSWRYHYGMYDEFSNNFIIKDKDNYGIVQSKAFDDKFDTYSYQHNYLIEPVFDEIKYDSIIDTTYNEPIYFFIKFKKDKLYDVFVLDEYEPGSINESLFPVYKKVSYDYRNEKFLKEISEKPFPVVDKKISDFEKRSAFVKIKAKDKNGLYSIHQQLLIVDLEFDSLIWNDEDSLVWVQQKDQWGLISYSGKNNTIEVQNLTNRWFDSIPKQSYLSGDEKRQIVVDNDTLQIKFVPNDGEYLCLIDTLLKIPYYKKKNIKKLKKLHKSYIIFKKENQQEKLQLKEVVSKNENIKLIEFGNWGNKYKFLLLKYNSRRELKKMLALTERFEQLKVALPTKNNKWRYYPAQYSTIYSGDVPLTFNFFSKKKFTLYGKKKIKTNYFDITASGYITIMNKKRNIIFDKNLEQPIIKVPSEHLTVNSSDSLITFEKSSLEDSVVMYYLYHIPTNKLLWEESRTIDLTKAKERVLDSTAYYIVYKKNKNYKMVVEKKAPNILTTYETKNAAVIFTKTRINYSAREDHLRWYTPFGYETFNNKEVALRLSSNLFISSDDTIKADHFEISSFPETKNYRKESQQKYLIVEKKDKHGKKTGIYRESEFLIPPIYDQVEVANVEYNKPYGASFSDYIFAWKQGEIFIYSYNFKKLNDLGYHKVFDVEQKGNILTVKGMRGSQYKEQTYQLE